MMIRDYGYKVTYLMLVMRERHRRQVAILECAEPAGVSFALAKSPSVPTPEDALRQGQTIAV